MTVGSVPLSQEATYTSTVRLGSDAYYQTIGDGTNRRKRGPVHSIDGGNRLSQFHRKVSPFDWLQRYFDRYVENFNTL